jgi:hypothetical protein
MTGYPDGQPVSRSIGALVVILVTVMAMILLLIPGAAQADPPGNNGTVKIDGVVFDDHPDNEPHVGCVFQVDFYGYDEGQLNADVTFEVHPPTGSPVVLLTGQVFIGEDAAGGGTDLDASFTYDLSAALAGYSPHPQQGHHVKLTVNAEGSIGADVKHKVFWVSGCGSTTSTSTSTSTSAPTTTGGSSISSSTSSPNGTDAGSGATSTSSAACEA